MNHEQLRKRHFELLNGYRNSAEYAAYAKEIGAEVPQGMLPSLFGAQWEIDKQIYHEALELLPPIGWRGGSFYMSEFTFGDITAKFSKEGDKYFCEFARYPEKAKPVVHTPWGRPDFTREIAPGIVRYDTPSHGGFYVSPERVAEMPKSLRDFQPFTKTSGPGRWFEEDIDWTIVALAFPQFFEQDVVRFAGNALKSYRPDVFEQFVAETGYVPPGKEWAGTVKRGNGERQL